MRLTTPLALAVASVVAISSGGGLAQQPAAFPPNGPAKTGKAEIAGVVLDSLHGRYLKGAEIIVEGADKSAITDSAGRFTIAGLPPGTYRVGVFHPLLDTLGIALATKPFRAGPDSISIAIMAIPSAATIVRGECPAMPAGEPNSAAIGHVNDPETLQPVVGAEVSVAWTEIEVSKEFGLRRTPHLLRDTTNEAGAFAVCGLPSSLHATMQARKGAAVTAEIPIEVGEVATALFARSLFLSLNADAKAGRASVSGRVLLEGTADKIGSRVELVGTDIVAMANPNGDFIMTNLPSGSQVLLARHLGYGAASVPVDLNSREQQKVTITLPKFVSIMDPVLVTARRNRSLDRVGFSKRMKSGTGHYLGPDQIEKVKPYRLNDILRRIPGTRIVYSGTGQSVESTRGVTGFGGGGSCTQFYVDGTPWLSMEPGDINDFIGGEEVVAVEVYQSPHAPPEFTRGPAACLTIVLWTRFKIRDLR